jgi:hypothetical protein
MSTLEGLEFGPETTQSAGRYGEGETERETRAALREIEEDTPLTGLRRTVKQLALSLARSIDAGNAKGRAVANEAAQLFAMMQQLAPAEDPGAAGDETQFTPETRRLLDALSSAPQLVPAQEGDGAEL